MFNITTSVRPIAVLEAPTFYKGNTYQVAVAATVSLADKDVPLMAAVLSPIESNQSRIINEVFKAYQELPAVDQETTVLNVGGLGWVSDHYRLNNKGNDKYEAYQEAMEFSMIPAEALGDAGDAVFPDIVLFGDTLEVTTTDSLQSYFSTDCGYLIVEESKGGDTNWYKLQSRGPSVGEEGTTNPRFNVSCTKAIARQFEIFQVDTTVQGAFAGNLGGYIGQDGTLKIRFSVSRFFYAKTFSNSGGVQRETMQRPQVGQASINPAVAALRNRMPKAQEVAVDDY